MPTWIRVPVLFTVMTTGSGEGSSFPSVFVPSLHRDLVGRGGWCKDLWRCGEVRWREQFRRSGMEELESFSYRRRLRRGTGPLVTVERTEWVRDGPPRKVPFPFSYRDWEYDHPEDWESSLHRRLSSSS